MELIILLWAFVGMFSAVNARRQGENWFWVIVWFFGGMALGPIGLVLSRFMLGVKCGKCKNPIEPSTRICPHCGAMFKK